MNTASRDRALLSTIEDVLGYNDKFKKEHAAKKRTPISKLKLTKEKDGSLKVALHTSRPNIIRMETAALTEALKETIGRDRPLTLEVVPEARAVAKWIRVSPRKARLVIDAVKGKRVSDAIAMLRFIPNQAAEHISKVLISAAANAMDGWGKDVEELKIVNIIADGGPTLKRVKPRAQGRAYRILKRTSHLTVILTDAPQAVTKPRRASVPAKPAAAAPAKATAASKKTAKPDTEETTAPEAATAEITTPEVVAERQPEVVEQAAEATPVTASDAPEEDNSGAAADNQTKVEGE